MNDRHMLLKALPKIDELMEMLVKRLDLPPLAPQILKRLCREEVDAVRVAIMSGDTFSSHEIPGLVADRVIATVRTLTGDRLKRVINASGVILHTNLGRAPLCEVAMKKIMNIACGYSNLEFDLERGERGVRYDHVRGLLKMITGVEDGLVVNNNAAAVLIAVNTLAKGKEVIVSRGELVEIGGEFRIPEIMEQSGATLREVGTTNRTHLRDYAAAIGSETALILKVHPSNFRVVGFASDVSITELVALGAQASLPVMFDLGSGNLIDLKRFGLEEEPTVQQVVASGADLVTVSGDKLLGGPQAGIILGRSELVQRIMKNPLNRALRIDKLTLAALEATLREYLDPEAALVHLPVLRAISAPLGELRNRARRLRRRIHTVGQGKLTAHLREGMSLIGGGALPGHELPTVVLAITVTGFSPVQLAARMRALPVPIIARVEGEEVLLDVRTILPEDILPLLQGLSAMLARHA